MPKIVKTCGKIGGICDRTVVTFGKTTEIFERTVRICDKTKERTVATGNSSSKMNALERVLGNSNRTGKTSGPIAKICKEIGGI